MINNQQNNNNDSGKGFGQGGSGSASHSHTGTKSFVAENLTGLENPKKNLVFVRKSGTYATHNTGNKNNHKKHGVRKVTSEFAVKREHVIPPLAPGNIRIIPLGGVQEVGKNMTAIEYGDDIIVIDAGLQFKTEDTPGIDYMLPNTKYLEQRKGKIRALVVTHGHLDHIGAIPFVMESLGNPPIYTREFGALLIRKRQAEFPHLPELNIKIITKDVGFFPVSKDLKIMFYGVTHSIPEASGIIIETPIGDIVGSGDVRIDHVGGIPKDLEHEQYKLFKNRKVLLLMADSTDAAKSGWGVAEDSVIDTIDEIIKNVPGRVILATFASQVERILHFIKIAEKYGKKLVIEGRSMKNNIEVIKFLKLADIKHVIPIEEMQDYPPHKIMMLATGAQGEEFAALMRMSNGSHKYIKLNKSDTIILSSSVIPGNERSVVTLKDNLYRHDLKIITYGDADVHSGGHAKRAALEWMHKQIPYRFFMPNHGNHYMLKIHAEVSRSIGTPNENIVVPDNGSIIEITDNGTKIKILKEKAPSGIVMVDGFSVGDVQEVVIRDRQALAQDGMFVIIASIDVNTGKLKKSPDIISRGFVYLKESQDLLKNARFIVKKTIDEGAVGNPINFDMLKDAITDNVSRYLFQETAKKPMVIPVVIGV
jgi:ribonuclease J